MFIALIWGIVHSCRSNVTRDMIKNWKIDFSKNFKFCNFLHFFLSNFFMLVTISLVIFDLQESAIPQIKAKGTLLWPYFLSFLATINNFWDRKQWSCFILFTLNFINEKNCKICNFLKQQIFSFFIISLVIFDLQEPIIPHIKAENILFGPYFLSFLVMSNIFWARKQWSCLIFFDPNFTRTTVKKA